MLVVAVLILGTAAYFIYQAIALHQNKNDFQDARSTIDTIYADITKKVGKPDSYNRVSDCTRTYQEFTGYSKPTCHVDTSFIYGVGDESAANRQFRKIQTVINTHHDIFPAARPMAKEITDQYVVDSTYHSASDRYSVGSLQCVVNYVYDTPREIFLTLSDKSKRPLEVTIGCYGPARQQYYPLTS